MGPQRGCFLSAVRIVVLGGAGMLGHKMFQTLRQGFPGTLCTVRQDLRQPPLNRVELLRGTDVLSGMDVSDFASLNAVLSALRPAWIVNCAGVIKQRPEALDPLASITINSLLPHKLSQMAGRWGGRVVHFSTDCVFSGRRGAYTEADLSDAEDLYGRTKSLGEIANGNALTLRTSIIGRELQGHQSLLDWFLARNQAGINEIKGYRRALWSGVTTNHLARLTASIIERHPGLSGLYQVASEPLSKYDLLCLLRDVYRTHARIEPDDREVSDRTLKCDKLREAIDYGCPPWQILAREMAEDKTPYEEWLKRE
ncbi:MAG: SDR family oxidoreductase [Terriglobia bacterium]